MEATDPLLDQVTDLYQDLHRHPELSGQEERTAARLAEWLTTTGLEVTAGVGGHGTVGLLHNGAGPLVAVRAELDALPVTEETRLSYASTRRAPDETGRSVPVSHACGHDMHVACAAGAVRLLAADRASWQGTLMVIGQPAEETLTGARAMLADGLYRRFGTPDVVLGQHLAPLPCGVVGHGIGPLTAASVDLHVTVHGRGGHGAVPHTTVDPIVVAAAVVSRVQTIVSRESNPFEPVVVTVGSLHAGSAPNVIPSDATLGVSIRCYSDDQLDRTVGAVRRIVAAESAAAECPTEPSVTVGPRAPVNVNDGAAAEQVLAAHRAAFGDHHVLTLPAMLASDDFPLFGPAGVDLHGEPSVRTVYWFLGSIAAQEWRNAPGSTLPEKMAALPANHSPTYAPALTTLRHGITALSTAARVHLR